MVDITCYIIFSLFSSLLLSTPFFASNTLAIILVIAILLICWELFANVTLFLSVSFRVIFYVQNSLIFVYLKYYHTNLSCST